MRRPTLPMVVGMKRARSEDHELFWAARFGRVGQLRELLQQGAAVDSVDPSHGHSALTAAASSVCHTQPPWAAPSQYSRLTPPVSPSPAPPRVRIRLRPRLCSSTPAPTLTLPRKTV